MGLRFGDELVNFIADNVKWIQQFDIGHGSALFLNIT